MKTLLILRHAKSSWKKPELPDHDRPLNKRGKRDAPRMGQLLNEEQLVPDLIISSTAERAKRTAIAAAETCGYDEDIQYSRELYFGDINSWLVLLSELPDECNRVMIVGHNPGLEQFLAMLADCDEHLPTAALVELRLPINSWSDLTDNTRGRVEHIWRPREIQS